MSIIDLRRNGSGRVPPDEHVRPRAPGHHPGAQRIARQHLLPFAIIGSAAAGRDVHDELDRIRRGERPAEDEVRRQWDELTAEARSRWQTVRTRVPRRGGRDAASRPPEAAQEDRAADDHDP